MTLCQFFMFHDHSNFAGFPVSVENLSGKIKERKELRGGGGEKEKKILSIHELGHSWEALYFLTPRKELLSCKQIA